MTGYADKTLREALVTALLAARQQGLLNDKLWGAVLDRWDELAAENTAAVPQETK